MKKKPQVKKQIVPVFQPSDYWTYKQTSPEDLQQAQAFLTTFDKDLKSLLVEPTLEDNYKILCDKIGTQIHPSLAKGRTHRKPEHSGGIAEEYGENYIMFVNHKIDLLTLKLLAFISPLTKLNTMKFSNLDPSTEEVRALIQIVSKDQNVSVLFYEWNPIVDLQLSRTVFTSLLKPNIKSLILRSSKIGDDVFKSLTSKILQSPDLTLKSLDVYDCNLTPQSIPVLKDLLLNSRTIQHLQLSKNMLQNGDSVKQLLDCVGMFGMSNEELQANRQLQKQKDEVTERNKKRKKGTPEQPIPTVLKTQQVNDKWYYARNTTIKSINLSWCNITSNSFGHVCQFADRVSLLHPQSTCQLNLTGNQWSHQQQQKLKGKLGIKV